MSRTRSHHASMHSVTGRWKSLIEEAGLHARAIFQRRGGIYPLSDLKCFIPYPSPLPISLKLYFRDRIQYHLSSALASTDSRLRRESPLPLHTAQNPLLSSLEESNAAASLHSLLARAPTAELKGRCRLIRQIRLQAAPVRWNYLYSLRNYLYLACEKEQYRIGGPAPARPRAGTFGRVFSLSNLIEFLNIAAVASQFTTVLRLYA